MNADIPRTKQNPEPDSLPNFHTHTALCRHAEGMPEDYIREAAKAGCSALGFSDHCPWPSESAARFWPETRMREDQLPLYLTEVKKAEETARRGGFRFPVYTGFECEWDASMRSWYKDDLLGGFGADYLVLGSHWLTMDNGYHLYIAEVTDQPSLLHRYTDQTIEGMASGFFRFLAHPDMFMSGWKEWDAEAEACAKALIAAAKDLGLPLEVNGFGMIKPPNRTTRGIRFQYPYREFWELAAAEDVKVICNSDAHAPSLVLQNARHAREFALEAGIRPENIMEDILQ
ncbi:MAG: histidinol-phosphatase [Spirochaetes bacterium]|uniref:Histidinol-phosphatase n=1 Tax=Candidatus Avitreponema avistercoris TaxID=2840705 RepID=A0A9D9HH93_9SPIR|nr:histidinol-phosphatase [Candidatus Avitreponema avistercoris]